MNTILPFLLLTDDDKSTSGSAPGGSSSGTSTGQIPAKKSSDRDLLLMVLISSMTGGMDNADGFANNFNVLLPLLLLEDGRLKTNT